MVARSSYIDSEDHFDNVYLFIFSTRFQRLLYVGLSTNIFAKRFNFQHDVALSATEALRCADFLKVPPQKVNEGPKTTNL